MTKLMKWTNLLLIFLTLLSYLSPLISPEIFWPLSLLGLAYPWLLLSNFLFIIYWGIQKKRYFIYSFITILIGWSYLISFIGLNIREENKQDNKLKIVSYNVHGLRPLWDKREKERYTKAHELFPDFAKKLEDIDFLCAQEASKTTFKYLSDSLDLSNILYFPEKKLSTYIFSKNKFIDSGSIVFRNNVNSCIWGDFKFQGKTIRIYNIHLQSNRISEETEKLAKEGNLQEKETWKDIKKVIARYKTAAQRRSEQAIIIKKHIESCPYPVILCGDVNDTPLSNPYHILSSNFQDSFIEKGQGIGTTYAGSIPALRIDYIFADQNFEILNHQIFKEIFSDHYPVVGTLKIKEK